MSDKPQKTIDDLAKEVIDSGLGVTSIDDLKVLFEEPPAADHVPPQEPVAPQALVDGSAPVEPQPPAEPDILGFVPDKFRDKDAPTSIKKMAQSYEELESALKKQNEEVQRLNQYVNALAMQPPPAAPQQPVAQPTQADGTEIDPAQIFEKPELVTEIARREAAKATLLGLAQYHEYQNRQQSIANFRNQHPDFDQYREDMLAVLKARPDLDQNAAALPVVFDLAKKRSEMRLDNMKKSLGIQPPQAPVDVASIKAQAVEEAKAAILEEVRRRRTASGLAGAPPPVSPQARATVQPAVKPKTPEEEVFDEMLRSGPAKLDFS